MWSEVCSRYYDWDVIILMGWVFVIFMLYEMVKKYEIDFLYKLSFVDGFKVYDIFDKKEDGNIKVILKIYGGVKWIFIN